LLTPIKPIVPLLDWQRNYIEDESRFKFVAASVQSGKSFGTSLEFCLERMKAGRALGIMLSASERQSVELMEKVKMHTRAWDIKFDDGFFGSTEIIEHKATFPNGNRIIALPANPDTARGYSGDVFLDEFALHRDSRAIWAAMMTRATRGYKVRVASTFKGTENKFYELAKLLGLHDGVAPERQPVKRNGWSGHWVDIYMAAAQGMPVDIEGQKAAIDDEEIWLQDYCNVPMSGADAYIPLELILAAESSEAQLEWDGRSRPGLCAGFDFARKRDGSVIIIGEPLADLCVVRGAIWMNRMTFAEQKTIARGVAAAVETGGGRFCMDATGIGAQLGEELGKEFPCVEAVDFGSSMDTGAKTEAGDVVRQPVKERIAGDLKRRYEERTLRLPESSRLRRAAGAVKRYIGPTGKIRLDAARTDTQGHADEFWALALLVAAMSGSGHYQSMADFGAVGGRTVLGNFMGRKF
jgi:phage FluMu gp28-like protein